MKRTTAWPRRRFAPHIRACTAAAALLLAAACDLRAPRTPPAPPAAPEPAVKPIPPPPEAAPTAVRAHEQEHVVHEQARARENGQRVVAQSVTIHYAVCPECGRPYVSGGTTTTTTKPQEQTNYTSSGKGGGSSTGGVVDCRG